MASICDDMGMEMKTEFNPKSDILRPGDFVLPIKTKDVKAVILRSPVSGCHIGRFPNTRRLCGKVCGLLVC